MQSGKSYSRCSRSGPATLLAALLPLLTPLLRADGDPFVPPLPLNEAVSLALRDNPQLRAWRARLASVGEQPTRSRALPNPTFNFSGMDMADGGDWPDTNEKRYMIEQMLPGFGKRGLRETIARADAKTMRLDLETATRDIMLEVRENYHELHATGKIIELMRDEEAVLRRMEEVAENLYATGGRAQTDVLKAQTETTALKRELLDLAAREVALEGRLNLLLDRPADAPLAVIAPPLPPADTASENYRSGVAATNRSEVLAAQALADRYELEMQLADKESQPDYMLGLEYRDIGGGDDMFMVTVGIDLPLWRGRNRAGRRAAERLHEAGLAAREAAERLSEMEARDAAFQLGTARRTLDLYRSELVPQAEARFNASEAAYRAGKVDFIDLLESQRFLLNTRIMVIRAASEVGTRSARLERALGTESMMTAAPETAEETKHEQ